MAVTARLACLNWTVLLLDRLASTRRLSAISAALFASLSYESLRAPAAYILCRISDRGGVLGWRVRALEGMLKGTCGSCVFFFAIARCLIALRLVGAEPSNRFPLIPPLQALTAG
jgi:hypothetical protein